jgi:hypothetical protein
MKTTSFFLIAFLISAELNAQQHYCFISQQQQSIKYDAANKAYFIKKHVNKLANINVTEKNISFTVYDNNAANLTIVKIKNARLDSLDKKMSFSVTGVNSKTGKQIKLGFWFIGEELDEVNYVDISTQTTIAYKKLSVISKPATSSEAIAKLGKIKK